VVPAAAEEFFLEFSDEADASIWHKVTSGIVNHGELLSFTFDLQVTPDAGFFRLRTTGLMITGGPRSQAVFAGNPASFQVTTRGPGPLRYQWYRGSRRIIGQTNATLTIPLVSVADAGSYRVVVADYRDAATSADAVLTVLTAPVIMRQPLDLMVVSNGVAQFSVLAEGGGQLAYQWKKDGVVLNGATASSLSVGPVSMEQDGSYSVVVSDANELVESRAARLTVLIPPAFLTQPLAQTVHVGDDVTFSVSMSGNPLPFGYEWKARGCGPCEQHGELNYRHLYDSECQDQRRRCLQSSGAECGVSGGEDQRHREPHRADECGNRGRAIVGKKGPPAGWGQCVR